MPSIDLKSTIRDIPDFPKPGIMFRDITTLLADPAAFEAVIDQFYERFKDAKVDAILAAEARGFIFAAPLAIRLGARFVPVRKPGKLPFDTESFQYELEYGTDTLEIHVDSVNSGDRVLMIDDLLATGGTIAACVKLAEKLGAEVVGCGFVIELDFLNGRRLLEPKDVHSLVHYDSE